MRIDNSINNKQNFSMAVKTYGAKNEKKFLTVIYGETKLNKPLAETSRVMIMPGSILSATEDMSINAKKVYVGFLSIIEKQIKKIVANDVLVEFGVKMPDTKIISKNRPSIGFDSEVGSITQIIS